MFLPAQSNVSQVISIIKSPQPLGGCRGTTDVLMIFLQPSLTFARLRVLARGSSVHSLMLSCQHFFGLPRLLPPGTVPCMMVFTSPVARVTCPYHLSFLVLTMERRSSCGPMAALTRFLASSFVILSLNVRLKVVNGKEKWATFVSSISG